MSRFSGEIATFFETRQIQLTFDSESDIIDVHTLTPPSSENRNMNKKNLSKILLGVLILLALAAGAVAVAWFAKNPLNLTPDSPENSAGSSVAGTTHVTQSLTDPSPSTEVTDPESSDVTGTETESNTETVTESNTETTTDTGTTNTEPPASTSTSTIPSSSVIGTITPPPDGSPKKVAFTFDDGPYTPVTKGIADEFAKYGGHCTYFVIGNRVRGDWQEAMKYAANLGNEIAIHAYTHTYYYDKCSEDVYQYELQATADVILKTLGKAPTLMRPVGGSITNARVAGCPYSVILWNVDTKDWRYKKESQANIDIIVQNILSAVTDGDIVLMHDIYTNTLEAVKIVLPILKEQGYEFVTISELMGNEIQTGKKYNKAY